MSDFTNEFYHLQSYIDLNELESYIILRYKMGLRWIIRKWLFAQSFYHLTDLVLATTCIEVLMERTKAKFSKS